MRFFHGLFSKLGVSIGGAEACLKYGCKEYCGYSLSEAAFFIFKKSR